MKALPFPKNSFNKENNDYMEQDILYSRYTLAELLILELKKPYEDIKRNPGNCKTNGIRNIDRIYSLLRKLKSFNEFIIINNIDDQSILNAAQDMKYTFIEKGRYLFKEGDTSSHFYGIISGKVSVRKKVTIKHVIQNEENIQSNHNNKQTSLLKKIKVIKPNNNKHVTFTNNENIRLNKKFPSLIKKNGLQQKKEINEDKIKIEIIEEELYTKGEGFCFGEWEVLYNKRRNTSILCVEDTYLFTLDEEHFKTHFSKCLYKAESDRKDFLNNNLFPFSSLSYPIINNLIKSTISIEVTSNITIYKQDQIANSIYIVYIDQFSLYKKYVNQFQTCSRMYKILSLQRGSILGLEAIFEEDKKYKYTLKADIKSGIGLIFKLNIENVLPIVIQKMKDYYREYYYTIKTTAFELYEKKKHLHIKPLNKNEFESLSDFDKCQNAINDYLENNEENKINCALYKRGNYRKDEVRNRNQFIKKFSLSRNNSLSKNSNINENASFGSENKMYSPSSNRQVYFNSIDSLKCYSKEKYNIIPVNSTIYRSNMKDNLCSPMFAFPPIKFSNESLIHCTNDTRNENINDKYINLKYKQMLNDRIKVKKIKRNASSENYLCLIQKQLNNGISKMLKEKNNSPQDIKKIYNYNSGSFDIPLALQMK